MAKKKQIKKIFEDMPVESTETNSELTESTSADSQSEATPSDQKPQQEVAESSQEEEHSSEEASPAPTDTEDISSDDLLGDVRRSLIEEEETDKGQKDSKWWRRIGKKNKRPEPEQAPVEIDLPEPVTATEGMPEPIEKQEGEEYDQQIDDLLNLLGTESEQSAEPTPPADVPVALAPESEPQVDFDDLKKQAL